MGCNSHTLILTHPDLSNAFPEENDLTKAPSDPSDAQCPCTIQIIDEDLAHTDSSNNTSVGAPSTEALLALKLRHPHVVSTLKYVVRQVSHGG